MTDDIASVTRDRDYFQAQWDDAQRSLGAWLNRVHARLAELRAERDTLTATLGNASVAEHSSRRGRIIILGSVIAELELLLEPLTPQPEPSNGITQFLIGMESVTTGDTVRLSFAAPERSDHVTAMLDVPLGAAEALPPVKDELFRLTLAVERPPEG